MFAVRAPGVTGMGATRKPTNSPWMRAATGRAPGRLAAMLCWAAWAWATADSAPAHWAVPEWHLDNKAAAAGKSVDRSSSVSTINRRVREKSCSDTVESRPWRRPERGKWIRNPVSHRREELRTHHHPAGDATRQGSLRTGSTSWPWDPRLQYSSLITKYEPRIVPASFDFCLANLNEASSGGTSIPSESLNPTARLLGSSRLYRTLIDRPLS